MCERNIAQPSGTARPLGQSPELSERTSLICTYFELDVIRIAMKMYDINVNNQTRRMGKIEWFFSSSIRLLLYHRIRCDSFSLSAVGRSLYFKTENKCE